jgi:hypothetical protein
VFVSLTQAQIGNCTLPSTFLVCMGNVRVRVCITQKPPNCHLP